MPRIRCHYVDCVFLDEGYCGAAAVEIDADTGCATYSPSDETTADEAADEELEEWDDEEEDDEDTWLDDEEDEI